MLRSRWPRAGAAAASVTVPVAAGAFGQGLPVQEEGAPVVGEAVASAVVPSWSSCLPFGQLRPFLSLSGRVGGASGGWRRESVAWRQQRAGVPDSAAALVNRRAARVTAL